MNAKKITMKRINDHIDFINQNGVAIAHLFDHQNHIIFDPLADSREVFGVDDKTDWPAFFAENGITVQSARQITARKITYKGQEFDINAARQLMDDDICEQIHGTVETEQEFFDAYVKAHEEKFGDEFVIN